MAMKLSKNYKATYPEELLRDFATNELGAIRCSEGYLDALRSVLGNQAYADRIGSRIEMNRKVGFATEKTMRNVIGQFLDAGIAYKYGVPVVNGYTVDVAFYKGPNVRLSDHAEEYSRLQREQELVDTQHMPITLRADLGGVLPDEVPY